jgi:stage V sporulation protein B
MKNKFIKSTIILIIGGLISKLLGMITKIIINRTIGIDGIEIYMLVMPTFLLFITLSQLGLPLAISKMIAENKRSNKKIIFSTIPIAFIMSIFLIIVIFIISPMLTNMLHNDKTYYPLISVGLTLPFISISSIIRGYFFGKEKMFPHIFSNVFEQILRLIMIIFITPTLLNISVEFAVSSIILFNIVSETISILILYFFLPKNIPIKKSDIIPNKEIMKDALEIGLPTTGSRLIGSITYFLEPIILTFFLLNTGYTNDFISREYGIITGYVMPLLLIPSFFTQAIGSALLPVLSKAYVNKNMKYFKNKIKQAIAISLAIGIVVTIFLIIKPEFLMKLLYNTTLGSNYIRIMAPFFLILYIQTPLVTALQAMNKSKEAMINTLMGSIIKILLLIILSNFKIGLYPLVIATVVNIIFVTINDLRKLKRAF